jgi:hypothetical protein
MNPPELIRLAREIELEDSERRSLRIAFGLSCVERAEHLLTERAVIDCLGVGKAFLKDDVDYAALCKAAEVAADLSTKHAGSNSLDGSGNAAVSTSYGVAAALGGRALEAAEYAAYAKVYSYASYAVTDLANYADEHEWQIARFKALIHDSQSSST